MFDPIFPVFPDLLDCINCAARCTEVTVTKNPVTKNNDETLSNLVSIANEKASALAGGILLLSADLLVRTIGTTNELKLGVVTALIGGPIFLFLILRLKSVYGV